MLILTKPDTSMLEQIAAYRKAFQERGDSMDGTGSLGRREDPEDWLADNKQFEDPETVPEHWVPATQFAGMEAESGKLVGMIQVRHSFNEYLRQFGGHIGYSVHPDHREKGYAKEMLRQVLPKCRELGLDKVLVTCDADNEASRRTILANGGVYESTVHEPDEDIDLERYWIAL